MKLTHALTVSLVAAAAVVVIPANAQYFNEGWKPGKPAQLPVQDDIGQAAQQAYRKIQDASGWTPPKPNEAAAKAASASSEEGTGLAGLYARFKAKAYPNVTFNAAVTPLTHTPHVPPLFGKKLTPAQIAAQGPTIEEQLGVPRSSVVSAARGARAVDDSAPWARARMAGGAAESAGVGSGSKGASALSFEPWVILVSSKADDAGSTRFNRIFNDTVNLIHPPPAGQEHVSDQAEASVETEAEEDKSVVEETLASSLDALKRLRFGHVDYFSQPAASWHWWVWKVPIILILTPSTSPERAYDIRYWRVHARMPSKARLLAILSDENKWKQLPIWTSTMAPGGERDHIPERIANAFSYLYVVLEKVPGSVIPLAAAMLAQPLLGMMHRRTAART